MKIPKFICDYTQTFGLPWWLSLWRINLQCRRPGLDPWVREIPWGREWLPTPVFLPGESHWQRSLVGYSPWGYEESDMTEQLTHTHTHTNIYILTKDSLNKNWIFFYFLLLVIELNLNSCNVSKMTVALILIIVLLTGFYLFFNICFVASNFLLGLGYMVRI